MLANGVVINFVRGDKIFQRGPNISSKSGPGVHFLGGSKYIVTGPSPELQVNPKRVDFFIANPNILMCHQHKVRRHYFDETGDHYNKDQRNPG